MDGVAYKLYISSFRLKFVVLFLVQHNVLSVGVNQSNPVSLRRCVSEAVPEVTRVLSVESLAKWFTNP